MKKKDRRSRNVCLYAPSHVASSFCVCSIPTYLHISLELKMHNFLIHLILSLLHEFWVWWLAGRFRRKIMNKIYGILWTSAKEEPFLGVVGGSGRLSFPAFPSPNQSQRGLQSTFSLNLFALFQKFFEAKSENYNSHPLNYLHFLDQQGL